MDGRNFLNLAQLEPGVQLQDGQTFDPTKAGYSSVSFNGVNGRTARIELDGVDISDETVGTTTLNIDSGSIEEFQVSRSTLDASSELTSSGSINVSTKSGTNAYHGELFGLFRDRRAGFAASPGGLSTPFQRDQFGGSLGGAIIKDKLFFFANSERIKQDQRRPLPSPAPFTGPERRYRLPLPRYLLRRQARCSVASKGIHAFYRFAYEVNSGRRQLRLRLCRVRQPRQHPRARRRHRFQYRQLLPQHPLRYEKFHNLIGDSTSSAAPITIPCPAP